MSFVFREREIYYILEDEEWGMSYGPILVHIYIGKEINERTLNFLKNILENKI